MSLTKRDIIEKVYIELGIQRNQSAQIVESLIELIKVSMESGDDILLSGFGKFCTKEKHERKGRNPSTGGEMMLKPRRVVTFKCSEKLREKINGPD